jgi:hypothetical protein
MPNIETIVRQINKELVPQFEEKLRAYLADKDKDWLIEQIVRLTLDAHSLEEMDRKHFREAEHRKRQERLKRVKDLHLDEGKLREFVKQYKNYDREQLAQEHLLSADAPSKGKELITDAFRSPQGTEILEHAKDMLFGFLFGDETMNTHFRRTKRQLLTLTIPRLKSDALNFMQATTELRATGTWQDSEGPAQNTRTENSVFEVEYGEIESETIRDGIITALKLINELEINEEILYGRMEKVEQSTLVS